MNNVHYIGWWKSQTDLSPNRKMPFPQESIFNNTKIAMRLSAFEDKIKDTPEDALYVGYRGFHACPLCGKVEGNGDFKLEYMGHIYVWNTLLRHMLEAHHIDPGPHLRTLLNSMVIEFLTPELLLPYPFESSGEDVARIWLERKPKGMMWNRLSGTIKSPTAVTIRAYMDGGHTPVHEETFQVEAGDLAELIQDRQWKFAEQVWEERKTAARESEVAFLVKQLFPEL